MVDIRQYAIILTLAILVSIFAFSFAEVFTSEPEYPDICTESQDNERPYQVAPRDSNMCENASEPSQQLIDSCPGRLNLNYNTCEYDCNCYEITQDNREQNEQLIFWVAIVLAGVAIVTGMLLPSSNPLNQWVGTGVIIGGVITLFVATIRYWSELDKYARPVVIAIEIAIVLWLTYKRFIPEKTKQKVSKNS